VDLLQNTLVKAANDLATANTSNAAAKRELANKRYRQAAALAGGPLRHALLAVYT
jgi:hypothetical protein